MIVVLIAVAVLGIAVIEFTLVRSRRKAQESQDRMWTETQEKIKASMSNPDRIASLALVRERLDLQQVYLDRVCQMAAVDLRAPKAVITMLDAETQVWIAHHFEDPEAGPKDTSKPGQVGPLTESYCQFTVSSDATFVVENATRHPLVKDNPCTTMLGMRAYLGSPVHSQEGFAIGSLCVFDYKPRKWTKRDIATIENLASLVTL